MSGSDLTVLFENANKELEKASSWFQANKLTLKLKKTKFMVFSQKDMDLNLLGLNLKICGKVIEQVGSQCKEKYFKFVGHVLDDKLSWQGHVQHICKKLVLQTRHNDFNYQNKPAVRRNLENFPLKCMIKTWNSLNIDVKSTADPIEFENILKESIFSKYDSHFQCDTGCFSCEK